MSYIKRKINLYKVATSYLVPSNINIFWNFGVLGFVFLFSQILTGVLLAAQYSSNISFSSLEHIMRDVDLGWFIRYLHANGASMFFLFIYTHMSRSLFYQSYLFPRTLVWIIGGILFFLMICTSFLGYVLPWGQMSYWAAIVITSLATAIPYIGDDILVILWGGFSVSDPTVNRFFSIHYLIPFILSFLLIWHVGILHMVASVDPIGDLSGAFLVKFGKYFIIKDLIGNSFAFMLAFTFICFVPNILGHSDNFMVANPLVTPEHIVPEWYFLPFYGILRSIPGKSLGVLALMSAIFVLIFFPLWVRPTRRFLDRARLRFYHNCFIFSFIVLGWIGGLHVITPYYEIGQACTVYYFVYFIFIMPYFHNGEYWAEKFITWKRGLLRLKRRLRWLKRVCMLIIKKFII